MVFALEVLYRQLVVEYRNLRSRVEGAAVKAGVLHVEFAMVSRKTRDVNTLDGYMCSKLRYAFSVQATVHSAGKSVWKATECAIGYLVEPTANR